MVGLHSIVPADAFTAETLGTERAGNGVVIDNGPGADHRLSHHRGRNRLDPPQRRRVRWRAHALGFDFETGFGLVQALGRLDLPPLQLGDSRAAAIGDRVVAAGAGGRAHSLAGQVIAAKQEFAGYWEYAAG